MCPSFGRYRQIPILLIVLSTLACASAIAQSIEWQQKFTVGSRTRLSDISPTQEGGYFAAGFATNFLGRTSFYCVKLDSLGAVQWGKMLDSTEHRTGMSGCQTNDSGFVIVGLETSNQYTKILLAKLDRDGNLLWTRHISDPDTYVGAHGVRQLPNGNLVIVGYRGTAFAFFIVDAIGSPIDSDTWKELDISWLEEAQVTLDGGFVVVGGYGSNTGLDNRAYIAKFTSSGLRQWSADVGRITSGSWGRGIALTEDGGYIIAAEVNGADFYQDATLIKVDSAGNEEWSREYSIPRRQYARSVVQMPDGGYVLCGAQYYPTLSNADLLVIYTDALGQEVWRRYLGSPSLDDQGHAVVRNRLGGGLVAGMADGNLTIPGFYSGWLLNMTDSSRVFTLVDAKGDTIRNTEFAIFKIKNSPPSPDFSDTLLFARSTDKLGRIVLPDSIINQNQTIKFTRLLHVQPATRHDDQLGTQYSIWLDNAKFSDFGRMYYDSLHDARVQVVTMDHTTIAYNLLVSIEWDTRDDYIATLENGFRYVANYLYDVYNGQLTIDTVVILDDGAYLEEADVVIFADNSEWPTAVRSGVDDPGGAAFMPRHFFGTPDQNRNESFSTYPYNAASGNNMRTIAHELGHYLLGFSDEYQFGGNERCNSMSNYGYMDSHYPASGVMSSELSSSLQYSDVACRNTIQYIENSASCFDHFELKFEKTYVRDSDSVYAEIFEPTERTLPDGDLYVTGPNDQTDNLDYDIGARVVFPEPHLNATTPNKLVTAFRRTTGTPMRKLKVRLITTGGDTIDQGQTSDGGKIRVLDVSPGDKIRASGRARLEINRADRSLLDEEWFYGEALEAGFGKSAFGNDYRAFDGDSIDLEMIPVQGDFKFIPKLSLSASGAEYQLFMNNQFPQAPSLSHIPTGGGGGNAVFTSGVQGFSSTVIGGLTGVGLFVVSAIDDSGASYEVDTEYSSTGAYSGKEFFAPDGTISVDVELSTPVIERVALLTSEYPILRNGLTDDNVQAGSVGVVAFHPSVVISGNSAVTIRYADSDLEIASRAAGNETSLRIFRWDEIAMVWALIGGVPDTSFNFVRAEIAQDGVYAAFTTAAAPVAPCGDFDASGQLDISDAVYVINYIFASGPLPLDAAAGDVDCSARVDIADAVYMVNYIFAGGAAPCAACL